MINLNGQYATYRNSIQRPTRCANGHVKNAREMLTRERRAVTEVVAWAASNGDRSENADYQYGKRFNR